MSAYFRVNFHIADNEDLRQGFVLTDDGASPLDLTDASLEMELASTGGLSVLTLSTTNGRIAITDATAGKFEIAVPAATIGTLPQGSYRHDLLLAKATETKRVWMGTLTVERGVTR